MRAPAAYHGIKTQHQGTGKHGDGAEKAREGRPQFAERRSGAAAACAAHAHFRHEKRQADRQGKGDRGEHEDGAAVGACHIGKFPDGA